MQAPGSRRVATSHLVQCDELCSYDWRLVSARLKALGGVPCITTLMQSVGLESVDFVVKRQDNCRRYYECDDGGDLLVLPCLRDAHPK